MNRSAFRGALAALICASMALEAAPVRAADSTAAATGGVLAGLGLQAAAGTSTLSAGGGTIEAELLASGGIDRAGALIVRLVDRARTQQKIMDRSVMLLAHDGVLDLTAVDILKARIKSLDDAVSLMPCTPPAPAAPAGGGGGGDGKDRAPFLPHGTSLTGADVVGALTTSQTISQITLSFDDRLIIDAVAAHAGDGTAAPAGWQANNGGGGVIAAVASTANTIAPTANTYVVPGEAVNIDSSKSKVFAAYQSLLTHTAQNRVCSESGTAAVITAVDALSTTLNSSSAANGPTPLETAMQLESLSQGKAPLVLRLATEMVGGTAITQANIWYALGFPGAVKVSAGLLVSYRLIDPAAGKILATGFVRCAVPPTDFSDVSKSVALKKTTSGDVRGAALCSYVGRP